MLFNISQIEQISDFQPISVKAKVLQKGEGEKVEQRLILTLQTKQHIVSFEIGKSHIIEGISINSFNYKTYLTTTKHSTVKQTDVTISIEPEHRESYGKVVVASVVAVS